MKSDERLEITQQLELLLADYWHDVDTNWGRNAGTFYTEDAVFEGSRSTYRGRSQIQKFYDFRLGRGERVAVHAVTNFRAVPEGKNRAVCTWYLHLHAHDGVAPQQSAPPIQIALMTDICVREIDGQWRYAHRKFHNLFVGGVATMSMDPATAQPN